MKTIEEIKNKILEIEQSELSTPRDNNSYKTHLTSLLAWVIE